MASETLKMALMQSAKEEYLTIDIASETENWVPSDAFMKQMDALLQRNQKSSQRRIKYALLVAAVIFLLSVVSVFSVAQVRENIIKFFKEYYYTHFEMEYGRENAGDIITGQGIDEVYVFSVLPDGYEQISRTQNEHSVITVYENGNGASLILSQGDGMTKRSIDAERLIKTDVVSNGTEYEVYSEDDYLLILWNTEKYTFSIDYSGDLSVSDIIDMAETMRGEKQ